MYQFCVSGSNENHSWVNAVEKVFELKSKEVYGVVASSVVGGRVLACIACDDKYKLKVKEIIKQALIDMYLTICKKNYLCSKISLPQFSSGYNEACKILIHTLVAFDRESETEIIENQLIINDSLALDGFFNFKLGSLSQRWDEIALLATSNSSVVKNDDSLNELLKFLMSAVNPKINKITILSSHDNYKVLGKMNEHSFEFEINSDIELLLYLINIAPIELSLHGEFRDKRLYNRLISIFDSNYSSV